jgi:hypothetical protein
MKKNSSVEMGCGEAMAEGLAFDVLHHDPEFAGVLDDVVDGAHVRVIEGGGALGFLEQAFAVSVSGVGVRGHALDGDMALQRGVFRAVDLSHAASAETLGDGEASDSGARQSVLSGVRRRLPVAAS